MADERDLRALRGDNVASQPGRGGGVSPRPLHGVGAGVDGAPLSVCEAVGREPAVPGDQPADARVKDDSDARSPLAAVRGGRLPHADRPYASPSEDSLTI